VRQRLAWRPSRAQALTWTALFAIFIVLATFNLRHLPSWWDGDATQAFHDLVTRYPDSLSSFSGPDTSPEGLLRSRHGFVQFVPGILAIAVIELLNLPLTDTALEVLYVGLATASLFAFYLLIRVTGVPRFVALAGATLVALFPKLISHQRKAGEAHIMIGLALSMLVPYFFYRYAEKPSRGRSWIAGLTLGAYFMSYTGFLLVLPAVPFAMVAGKAGTIRERLLAAGRDALRPGLWLPAILALGIHVYFWKIASGEGWSYGYHGLLEYVVGRNEMFPFAFRWQFLWDILTGHSTTVLAIATLVASGFALAYLVRVRREAVLLVLGWAYLGSAVLKMPLHGPSSAWNLYGVIPLVLLAVAMAWKLLKAAEARWGWRWQPAIFAFLVLWLLVAIPLAMRTGGWWAAVHGRDTYAFESHETGTKALATYLRQLPDEGGRILGWGYSMTAPVFYFPPSVVAIPASADGPTMRDVPDPFNPGLDDMEYLLRVADTFVINHRVGQGAETAERITAFEPGEPFTLSAVVRETDGTTYARVYRADRAVGEPIVIARQDGEALFDETFHRLRDYRRHAVYWPGHPPRTCDDPPQLMPDEPAPTPRVGPNVHPNPDVETDLSHHGSSARARMERTTAWAADGQHSVRVEITEDVRDAHRGTAASWNDSIAVLPNTSYLASVVARAESSCALLTLSVREWADRETPVAYRSSRAAYVGETPSRISFVFTTQPDTTAVGLEVRSGPKAEIPSGFTYFYDAFSLAKLLDQPEPLPEPLKVTEPSEVGLNIHPNPSVEIDMRSHGSDVNATVERSKDWAADGRFSVKVMVDEATASHQGTVTGLPHSFAASAGTQYRISVVARSGRGSGGLQVAVREFNSEGDEVNYSPGTAVEVGVEPRELTRSFTSGPDTARIGIEVRSGVDVELPVGFVFYYDDVRVWPADASRSDR